MKKFFVSILILLLLLLSTEQSAQTSSRTFIKSFHLDGASLVRLDLPGDIVVREWDNAATLRFEISVSLPAGSNPSMLNELANAGRYNLNGKMDAEAWVVDAPNLQRQIKVKGQELKETVQFTVYAPKNVRVALPPVASVAEK